MCYTKINRVSRDQHCYFAKLQWRYKVCWTVWKYSMPHCVPKTGWRGSVFGYLCCRAAFRDSSTSQNKLMKQKKKLTLQFPRASRGDATSGANRLFHWGIILLRCGRQARTEKWTAILQADSLLTSTASAYKRGEFREILRHSISAKDQFCFCSETWLLTQYHNWLSNINYSGFVITIDQCAPWNSNLMHPFNMTIITVFQSMFHCTQQQIPF